MGALKIEVPRDLSHAVLTYNAGEIMRRADRGRYPGATGSMDAENIFQEFRPALGAHWPAFPLDGRISRKVALRRILREVAKPAGL